MLQVFKKKIMMHWIEISLMMIMMSCFALSYIFSHLSFTIPCVPETEGVLSIKRFMKRVKTGDLILFSGTCRDSATVKCWSRSVWSHVGIVIVDEKTNVPYLFHSDAVFYRKNIVDGKYREGTQVNDLRLYISTYPGYVVYCPLLNTQGCELDEKALKDFILKTNGKEFNHDWFELLRCTKGKGGGFLGSKPENTSVYFCSQLVARALYKLGALGKIIPFNEYHPSSFVGDLQADWIRGFHSGPLYLLQKSRLNK